MQIPDYISCVWNATMNRKCNHDVINQDYISLQKKSRSKILTNGHWLNTALITPVSLPVLFCCFFIYGLFSSFILAIEKIISHLKVSIVNNTGCLKRFPFLLILNVRQKNFVKFHLLLFFSSWNLLLYCEIIQFFAIWNTRIDFGGYFPNFYCDNNFCCSSCHHHHVRIFTMKINLINFIYSRVKNNCRIYPNSNPPPAASLLGVLQYWNL